MLLVSPMLFAVDDASFLRMAVQTELLQPFLDDVANKSRLSLTVTVQYHIVAVPLEPHHRKISGKPGIQCVVQEEV